jgi:hypothetical protein
MCLRNVDGFKQNYRVFNNIRAYLYNHRSYKFKSNKTVKGKGKAIPVTGCGGPYVCETSRLPHFLGNWFTDGGEVVSLTRRPTLTPRKIPGTHLF